MSRFMRLMLGDTGRDADHYASCDHEAASDLAGQTFFLVEKASHDNRCSSRLTTDGAEESKGQRQMSISQDCVRWLSAVLRLQLLRLDVFYVGLRNAPLERIRSMLTWLSNVDSPQNCPGNLLRSL